jgi:AAA domain
VSGERRKTAAESSLVTRAAAVKSRSIRWAWTGRLALGYLTVETGIEGLGKSVFAAWLIARLTRGELPGEWREQPVDVLIVASEDGIADTWKPRLVVAGADLERVAFLDLSGLPPTWNLRDGIAQVRSAVAETSARMVFIDAALDHMPPPQSGESINSPTFVRRALGPLKGMARDLDLVGLFSMHPPKAKSTDFRDLVQSSQAFGAIPRIGLLFAYHPDDDAGDPDRRRVLIRGKGNIGRDPGAMEFRVVGREHKHDDGRTQEVAVVEGVGASRITMADLAPERLVGARTPTKREQAAEVMREELADGEWHPAALVRVRLGELDLDGGSVRAPAMRLAGVEKRKRPGETNGPWEWRIPSAESPEGPLDPSTPRARSLTDEGLFDSKGVNRNNHGKGPRVPNPLPLDASEPKSPPSEGYRAHAREASDDAAAHADSTALAPDAGCVNPDRHRPRWRPHPTTGRTVCDICHPPNAARQEVV